MNNQNFNPNQSQNSNNTPNQYQPPQWQQPQQGQQPLQWQQPPQGYYPNAPIPPKNNNPKISCLAGCGAVFLAFVVLFVFPIARACDEPSTSSSSQTKVSSIAETSSANTSTELEDNTNINVEIEKETDTTIESRTEKSSLVQSKAESETEVKTNSENTSKLESSSKIEPEKTKSDFVLDFDSVQYGEYNIDGLEIPNGKIESVIRGGSDGNTLVVKVIFEDSSSPTMKSYENVCDLIINHGFDKGSKIDYWAVNSDGVKIKSFILDSSYFNDIKDGTLPYNALHLFLQDEYPTY